MIDERVALAILSFVDTHGGRPTYREIRTRITAHLGISKEIVIWNEVQDLIHVDDALDDGGVIPGDRDRLAVSLTATGRDILNRKMATESSPTRPGDADESPPRPKMLEW